MFNLYKIIRYIPLSYLKNLAKLTAWIICKKTKLKFYKNVQTNIQLVYPELDSTQQTELIEQSIYNQCMSSVESAKSWAMHPKWSIRQIKKVHHYHILEQALKSPNGVLLVVPHLGTWEMMNAWVAQHGALTIMYKPASTKMLEEFILNGRQRLNATLVPTDATGVKAIFKTLKSGGFSVILPDHVPDMSGGIIAPFFNIPTLTSTLASKLISKTRCMVVGLTCIRNLDCNGFEIYCVDLNDERMYNQEQKVTIVALNQAIEKMINRFPEHYMWSYRRFKHVPNVENVYELDKYQIKQLQQQLKELENQND